MFSVLVLIVALQPVNPGLGGTLAGSDDVADMLAMGYSLGTFSCEPGIPRAICSLKEGGFAVVTERPGRVIFIDGIGQESATAELPDSFPRPRGVVELSRGHLAIVDDSGALGEIDRAGRLVRMLPGPKPPWSPGALALTPGGAGLLVTDLLRAQVHRLDLDGILQQSWDGFVEPRGIAAVGDKIWVSDRGIHRLLTLDPATRSPDVASGIGDHGAAPGLLAGPMGMCAFGDRMLLVADRDNHRIQVFGSHGISMHQWGVHARIPREAGGRLHYPEAIALDKTALVCAVIEPSERRVQRFGVRDPELAVVAEETWQRVDLVSHYGEYWAVEEQGRLLVVSEPDSERVTVVARDPEIPFVLDDVGGNGSLPAQFRTPAGVDFMPARPFARMVVADRGNRRLQMFEVRRNTLAKLQREAWLIALVRSVDLEQLVRETPGWHATSPPRPGAVACLKNGTIAVSDTANARILLFDEKFRPKGILSAPGMLEQATAIAADGAGILVADASSGRLLRFLLEGGRPITIESKAVVPVGIDRHPDGSIWVTDAAQHALFRISPEGGDEQVVLRGPGTGKTELYRPRSVQIAGDGSVWVLDHGNHRGVVLKPLADDPLNVSAVRHFGSRPYLPQYAVSTDEGDR